MSHTGNAEGRITVLAITDVVLLADGRAAALVATVDPSQVGEGPTTVHFTFEQVDGGWLIDDIAEFHTHSE